MDRHLFWLSVIAIWLLLAVLPFRQTIDEDSRARSKKMRRRKEQPTEQKKANATANVKECYQVIADTIF